MPNEPIGVLASVSNGGQGKISAINSAQAEEIAKQTIEIGANVLWLQLGIHNENAAKLVSQNKIYYISNKCIKNEYDRLFKTI